MHQDSLSEAINAWAQLSDVEITSLFSQEKRLETGETTGRQRLLLSAIMPPDWYNRSQVQNAVNRAILAWESSNHPAKQDAARSSGVLQGASEVYSHINLTVQQFFNQLQQLAGHQDRWSRHYVALAWQIRAIFSRVGRYAQLVEEMDPGAQEPSPTVTRLDLSTGYKFNMYTRPEDISERQAAEYLWCMLQILREVAAMVFEPYARRQLHVSVAMDVWRVWVEADAK